MGPGWRRVLTATLMLGVTTCTPKDPLEGADLQALEALTQEVEQDRLWSTLLALTDKHLQDSPVSCASLPYTGLFPELCHLTNGLSRSWVKEQLQASGMTVRHDELERDGFFTSNLVAELPGTTHPEEVVVVGAHFDAFYAGADDNSSGVAAMLELARVLSRHRFPRTIRFVGFDLEEHGVRGSYRYVGTLGEERIINAVIFDCIGYYSDEPGSQTSLPGLPAPSVGNFLTVIGNDLSKERVTELYALNQRLELMPVVPLISPRDGTSPTVGPMMWSDHTPFWLAGKQAVFLTDTAPFRNPHYHKETDTPDKLDPVRMTQAVRVAAASIAYWAGGPR